MSIAPPTEQRVLDAAQHLLQMHGYHGLSYAAVAAVVGLRKASVFHYFPTKDALARAVVARYRATVRGKMALIDGATGDPHEKLVRYVALYRGLLERREHMCLCGLLAAEALTLPASVQTELRGYFTEHEAWLGEVLAAGNAAAVLHLDGPVAVAAQSESVQEILNITATVERFGVTFLGAGIQAAEQKRFNKDVPAPVLAVLKAARAQEQFHLEFFERAGGRPFVRTFTVPPAALTDYDTFFGAVVEQETAEVAAQLAAIRIYTALRRPDLVKVAFQYAAEESEHRVLANYALGARPANDHAFAPMLFTTVGDIVTSLKQRGLIGGAGIAVTYPGPGMIDASHVTNRTPNGPSATCAPTR